MAMNYRQAGSAATLPRPRPAGIPASRARPVPALTRAVLADDEELIHLAVGALLGAMPGYTLAASADSIGAAERLVHRLLPDLLITEAEIRGESGVGLCWWARKASPRTFVVILTGRDDPRLAQSALDAGARGYLLKSSPPEALATYLEQVSAGRRVLDERLGHAHPPSPEAQLMEQFGLSRREREVLVEVLSGFGNKMIAGRLHISEDTVKSHMKAIFRKLGARDRAHAVALALGRAPLAPLAPLTPATGALAPVMPAPPWGTQLWRRNRCPTARGQPATARCPRQVLAVGTGAASPGGRWPGGGQAPPPGSRACWRTPSAGWSSVPGCSAWPR
ncbi:MAG: response regulator transcription factor [Actinomycetota bacterium]